MLPLALMNLNLDGICRPSIVQPVEICKGRYTAQMMMAICFRCHKLSLNFSRPLHSAYGNFHFPIAAGIDIMFDLTDLFFVLCYDVSFSEQFFTGTH